MFGQTLFARLATELANTMLDEILDRLAGT